jgi:hypothetical protein
VRRVTDFVAYAETEFQIARLKAIEQMLTAQGGEWYAGMRFAWDETRQAVGLAAVAEKLKPSQLSSTWEIMVTSCQFFWGTAEGAAIHEFLTPPVPLLSNASAHIHGAMAEHPQFKALADFKRFLKKNAVTFFDWLEADGHPANEKLYAHWSSEERCDVCSTHPGGPPGSNNQ